MCVCVKQIVRRNQCYIRKVAVVSHQSGVLCVRERGKNTHNNLTVGFSLPTKKLCVHLQATKSVWNVLCSL